MNGNIKMRIKGILYTGKTVYECLCKAVREPINIHARMVDIEKKITKKPTTKMEDNNGIY
jgi:hypothetical protein